MCCWELKNRACLSYNHVQGISIQGVLGFSWKRMSTLHCIACLFFQNYVGKFDPRTMCSREAQCTEGRAHTHGPCGHPARLSQAPAMPRSVEFIKFVIQSIEPYFATGIRAWEEFGRNYFKGSTVPDRRHSV